MSHVFGLPTHPLVVHMVVILVPLAAAALIATGWREQWRRTYLLPIALLAIAGAVAAFIATSTGEDLQHSIREAARAAGTRASFGDHPEEGDRARLAAIAFALCAAGFCAVVQWGQRLKLASWTVVASYALSSMVGVVAIATVVIAGHSGATLVWKDLGTFVKR